MFVRLAILTSIALFAPLFVGGSFDLGSRVQVQAQLFPELDIETATRLNAGVRADLEALLTETTDPRDRGLELWNRTISAHGRIDPLLDELRKVFEAEEDPASEEKRQAVRLAARLLRRLGDLDEAKEVLARIEPDGESIADSLERAEILDAIGLNDEALAAYDRLLGYELDADLRNRTLLRQALMRKKKRDERSPLAIFASEEGRADTLKNRASVVLALREEQKDAIDLFTVTGKGSKRFRQEIRLAEWALEAEAWDRAQEFAWQASRSAELKRDRRYALTILVEGYRRDDALPELIERFAKTEQLDDSARQIWIDLLRETGRVDEALALFRTGTREDFTVDMRRELLEMCRETGRDETLIDAYRQLITEEPRSIEWREGLSRFYLERGDREAAIAIWKPYLEVTEEVRYRMAAAGTLGQIGLDDLAAEFARACMTSADQTSASLLFLFELARTRGELEEAEKLLDELNERSTPESAVRKELAENYAQLGDKKRAVAILEALHEVRGTKSGPDSQMKLAILLSDIGEEDRALEVWQQLWLEVDSIPRRRYIEDRLMNVASRLGKLAKIAIRLETKLLEGTANDREAGLLVRLYTKVKDPVSATEIIDEHLENSKSSGIERTLEQQVDALTEKARVFLSCEDYYNYEQIIKQLAEIDPDGRPDYLRQLAMSNLERGQRREAQAILAQLKEEEADTASLEFEAGVLALSGLREEAIDAYRKSLAQNAGRIDTYLLLSNVQKELGQHNRTAAMFQFLAATAERDDLFTIAVDGILNLRDGRANRGAPDRLVEWTRRVVLERLAGRPNKLYLYRLVADLSEELNDRGMAIRALKAALPIAGEQRTQLLRELMTMAQTNRRPTGMIMIGGPARPAGNTVNPQQLMFGRRLLGQGDLVPPQVYLELGEAFLMAGEVVNATKTFNQASQLPEFAELRRKIASAFERAQYPREGLRVYEQILTVETSDAGLLCKVGELHEQLGRDDTALSLYQRGLDLLLTRRPFARTQKKTDDEKPDTPPSPFGFAGRNVDEFDTHYEWLLRGILATASPETATGIRQQQREQIELELARVKQSERAEDDTLAGYPRLSSRTKLYRRLSIAYGDITRSDGIDQQLLEVFPKDEKLLERLVRERKRWGYLVSARRLIEKSGRADDEQAKLLLLVGGGRDDELPGAISVAEASGLLLPLLAEGRRKQAKAILERVDLATGEKSDLGHMPTLISAVTLLDESELALGLFRHWFNLAVKHSGNALYAPVQSLLQQSRQILDEGQRQSMIEYMIDTVVEKPDQFSSFISRLPDLQQKSSTPLMTTEQVESLIRGRLEANDRFIYGIPELFALIPADDRASVLRSIWSKVPKTQRALFLLQLLPKLDQTVETSFDEYLVASFKGSIGEVENKDMLSWYVEDLVDGGDTSNLATVRRFIEILRDTNPEGNAYQVAYAMVLQLEGKDDEAFAVAREVYQRLVEIKKPDYRAQNSFRSLVEAFHENHLADMQSIIADLEEKRGPSVNLTERRLDLLARQDDPQQLLVALRKATEDHPDEVPLWTRLRRQLDVLGLRFEAVEVQEKIAELEPKKDNHRNRLERDWKSLRHPIKALATREKPDEDESKHVQERVPPASIARVKTALKEDSPELAQTTFRRLWRVFPDRSNRYFRWQFDSQATRRIVWPRDPKPKDPTKKVQRYRGGLPKFEIKKAVEPEERITAQRKLADTEFGGQELEAQLRSLDANQLNSVVASDLFEAMTATEVAKRGAEAARERILAAERAGNAGKKEYGLLFALLEQGADQASSEWGATLDELMKNLDPSDTAQLRRLARLFARAGQEDRAVTLYTWCAVSSQGTAFNYYNSAGELLDEVIEHLDGEARNRVVTAVLDFGNPGDNDYWGGDFYDSLVLDTWKRLVGPTEALERAKETCERVLKTTPTPKRRAAQKAAYLYARAGQHERAVACLEVALCKLDVPTGLEYPWLKTYFTNPGRMGTREMTQLFPDSDQPEYEEDAQPWVGRAEWIEAAANAIEGWLKEDRLAEDQAFRLLALFALRSHQSGATEEADRLLAQLEELGKNAIGRVLWVADLLREFGHEERADALELKLLTEQRLHIERIPEVVARVRKEDPKAALELAEQAAKYTLHPDLTQHLIELTTELDQPERHQHWVQTQADAEAAVEALKEKKDA